MPCKNCFDGLFCQNKCVRPDKAKQKRIQEMKEYSREVDEEEDDDEITELTEFEKSIFENVNKRIDKDITEWKATMKPPKEDKE